VPCCSGLRAWQRDAGTTRRSPTSRASANLRRGRWGGLFDCGERRALRVRQCSGTSPGPVLVRPTLGTCRSLIGSSAGEPTQTSDARPVRDAQRGRTAEVDELRAEHSSGRGMSFGAPGIADREMKWPDG
jgi:hypothetical protein